jgi:hypothetical protein
VDRFLTAVLNPPALLYLLLMLAFPRVAWPATPSPMPTDIPTSVLPLSLHDFCEARGQGSNVGRGILTERGLYVRCERGDWLLTKVGVPALKVTPMPGLTPR